MRGTSKVSEKEAVRNQYLYGHLHNPLPIDEWLHKNYSINSPLRQRINQFKPILEKFPEQSEVLEIGAGAGDFSLCLLSDMNRCFNLIQSDLDMEYLKRFSIPTQKFFSYSGKVQRLECDVSSIPFDSDSISIILIKSAVHHFENPKQAFKEIHRCLVPEGIVIFINDPQISNIWTYIGRKKFAKLDKSMGYNCNSWTHSEYMRMGKGFSRKAFFLDPLLIESVKNPQLNWSKKKRALAFLMLKFSLTARVLNRKMGFSISYMFVK